MVKSIEYEDFVVLYRVDSKDGLRKRKKVSRLLLSMTTRFLFLFFIIIMSCKCV